MHIKWEQKGNNKTIKEAVTNLSNLSENELLNPREAAPIEIENLVAAAEYIKEAINNKETITIIGDYDADGVCSTAILFLLLTRLGTTPMVRIPKRLSEGYGISEEIVDEISTGLVITVDNGISAFDAIDKAIKKGLKVVILDHHLPPEILPLATVIVDPHVNPNNNKYVDFCGAGLAYKLAEYMLTPEDKELLFKLETLAATATIADVMPLTGTNRAIVKKGLKSINAGLVTKGFTSLIGASKLTVIDEGGIGFKIAPIINAAGRLFDDGAKYACACLAQDTKFIPAIAEKLVQYNEDRKALVEEGYNLALEQIKKTYPNQNTPPKCIVIHIPELHEGITGIIAGKLAEEYKVPTFVFTGKEGLLKGSGRTYGNIHLKELLDKCIPLIHKYGGHAGAAGLTVEENNLDLLLDTILGLLEGVTVGSIDTINYDLCINSNEVLTSLEQLKPFAPYGEHNPAPIFKIEDIVLREKRGSHYKFIGKDLSHLKLDTKNYALIGFGLSEKYKSLDCPQNIDVIGKISMNESSYGSIPQVEIIDIRPSV